MSDERRPRPGDVWERDGKLLLVIGAFGWGMFGVQLNRAQLVDSHGDEWEWRQTVPEDARFCFNALRRPGGQRCRCRRAGAP